jgi:septal ring-binding cell division protein DamX
MAAPATAAPPPPTMAPARVNEPVSLAQARILMRQGQLPQAARGFQTNVKAAPSGTLSVQLLVACAPETVQKAVDGVQSDELFILPVNYKGRDCFRMCWGLYSTQAKATSALRALPEYFRIGGATPKVAPVASLLP